MQKSEHIFSFEGGGGRIFFFILLTFLLYNLQKMYNFCQVCSFSRRKKCVKRLTTKVRYLGKLGNFEKWKCANIKTSLVTGNLVLSQKVNIFTLYIAQWKVTVYSSVYIVQWKYTLYSGNIQCTVYSVHCIVDNIKCTLNTVH